MIYRKRFADSLIRRSVIKFKDYNLLTEEQRHGIFHALYWLGHSDFRRLWTEHLDAAVSVYAYNHMILLTLAYVITSGVESRRNPVASSWT